MFNIYFSNCSTSVKEEQEINRLNPLAFCYRIEDICQTYSFKTFWNNIIPYLYVLIIVVFIYFLPIDHFISFLLFEDSLIGSTVISFSIYLISYLIISIWNPKKVGEFYKKKEIGFFNPKSIFLGYKKSMSFGWGFWVLISTILILYVLIDTIKTLFIFFKYKYFNFNIDKGGDPKYKYMILNMIPFDFEEIIQIKDDLENNKLTLEGWRFQEFQKEYKSYDVFQMLSSKKKKEQSFFISKIKKLKVVFQVWNEHRKQYFNKYNIRSIFEKEDIHLYYLIPFIPPRILIILIIYILQPRRYSNDLNKKYLSYEELKLQENKK